jgi:type I restriction enzyme R subunit
LSQRLKNRELDLVIVVNMFLTGFDATTLNTLWVDKNLRAHGLIQAYSRTNRILNSVKTYGNIVSFRDLEQETNDALALFGNKDAKGIVLLKPYAEYYAEYEEEGRRTGGAVPARDSDRRRGGAEGVHQAVRFDPAAEEHPDGLRRFRRQRNPQRPRFSGLPEPLPEPVRRVPQRVGRREGVDQRRRGVRDRADQAGRDQRRLHPDAGRAIPRGQGHGEDKEIRATIERAINSSPSLRNKKDLIEQFVDSVTATAKVDAQWQAFVAAKKVEELDRIIAEENLNADETRGVRR